MNRHVAFQMVINGKPASTFGTLVWPDAGMRAHVSVFILFCRAHFAANLTRIELSVLEPSLSVHPLDKLT